MTEPIAKGGVTSSKFPVAEITTLYPVIGSPSLYDEVTQAIRNHGDRADSIPFSQSFQELRMPITSRLFKKLKLRGEGAPADFLLLRSMEVFTFPGEENKRGTVGLLVYVPGTAESEKGSEVTEAMIDKGILLSAAYLAGDENPIRQLELIAGKQKGTQSLRFNEMGVVKTFDPSSSASPQTLNDKNLFGALFAAQTFVANNLNYLYLLFAVNDIGTAADEEYKKSTAAFYNQFALGFKTLEKRQKNLPVGDRPFARAAVFAAKQTLALPKADLDKAAELSSHSSKLLDEALKKFRWQEGNWAKKPMTRAEFYSVLEETADPAKRRNLVEGYSAAVLSAHKEGLFEMVPQLNAIARKNGYASFPDYNDRVFFGTTPKEFEQTVESFHAKYGSEIGRFIDELKELNGGKPVYEWDVDHLTQKYIAAKTGQGAPKLTFDEAFAIATRFFKDIGWDLDQPPFKDKIFFDMKKRENKYGNAFAQALEDGSRAWFNTNFDPGEKITLTDLNTIIHELTHDAQFILGAKNGRGNVITGYGAWPTTWAEGSAMTMGDVVFNPHWMGRYLSHLEEFKDPKKRGAAAEALYKNNLYTNMMVLCRALWENGLYEDADADGRPVSLDQRLHRWEAITRKYMHVETMDATKGAYVYATPHFAGIPAYYVSYGGGRALGVSVMEPLIKGLEKNDPVLIRHGGDVFAKVLGMGAQVLTASEIAAAIGTVKRD